MMRRQRGHMDLDLGGLIVAIVVIVALIAAPLGWLLIEGCIWLVQHVSVSLK